MENKESKEINLLLGEGFAINTILFGKPKRWITKKMTLGRLIELSKVFIKMKEHSTDNAETVISSFNLSVSDNARLSAEAMAICVSNNKIIRWFLVRHFLNNISAKQLLDFANRRIQQSDYMDFIFSIELMKTERITKANPVEKQAV